MDEVEHLDIKTLLALQKLLSVLKISTLKSNSHLGTGAKLSRETLINLPQELSQAIIDDREERPCSYPIPVAPNETFLW